ncbi:MAG: hypothetical protein M3R15_35505 [Acidobacteriota bacterium]|nr:hypothetical protein [Acidobacteriota bacterium]
MKRMRNYDYVRDGMPEVNEAPAHIFTELLEVYEEIKSEWFWETQAENYSPEDREWLCSYSVNVLIAELIDSGTRNNVCFFTSYFTPEVCSMN